MTTGIIYTPDFQNHQNYPECPDRAVKTAEYFQSHGISDFINPLDYGEKYIGAVHTAPYIQDLKSFGEVEGIDITYADALLSANGCITAGDMLLSGEIENAFVLNRPPGHHTYAGKGGGFCYLNNAAILARYLQSEGMSRVMIIDWDAHHGNGTEAIFYEDPSVLYTSIHQTPLYPGTGKVTDLGTGDGEGYNVNIPVPPGTGHDTYMDIFDQILIPAGENFRPDAVIISAGQDSHDDDPLTDIRLSSASYHLMTRMVLEQITSKTIAVLEGGYNLDNLVTANYAIATALREEGDPFEVERVKEPKQAKVAVSNAINIGKKYGYL